MFNNHRKWFFLTIMLLFSVIVVPSLVVSEQTDAAAAITSAKEQVVACYQAAKDAEGAGANITSLTATLNDAGALLSRAELAYSSNDFGTARDLAVQSRERLDNFVSEANALKETAIQQGNQDFMINVVGSAVGAIAVVVGGFAVWNFLKRKYDRVEARS
ncbi:hypothetical protein MUO79_07300 [Candidatus Bathyarchaeota archaeon]|nr:hypothetical protein [Candidatus Bathyarchaeota archaeon]